MNKKSSVWTAESEKAVLVLREEKKTYAEIGEILGVSATSVKHKIRRLQQDQNQDRYKHTAEKIEQVKKFITGSGRFILETNCGFGGLTEFYSSFGEVEGYDIKKDRVDHVNALGHEDVIAIHADSEKEIYRLLYSKCVFDVVDIDPYGMPSRYFPHAFGLIDDGVMFITLPMIGVAQINKITIRHLQSFWGVELSDKDSYVEKVIERLKDYAFMFKRELEVLDVAKIDRIYRLCLKVQKKSCCDIVGLTVNRARNAPDAVFIQSSNDNQPMADASCA